MSREEFFDLSWQEFNWAAEGYYEDLRQRLGIPDKKPMDKPTDVQREKTKQKAQEWITFFKRPTLTNGEPTES